MLAQNRLLVTTAMVHLHDYLLHLFIIPNISVATQEGTLSVEERGERLQGLGEGKRKIKSDGKAPTINETISDWFDLGLRTSVIQKTPLVAGKDKPVGGDKPCSDFLTKRKQRNPSHK